MLLPTRLTRYVLWEISKVFVIALTALTALILVGSVSRELMRAGMGLDAVIRLLPFILPISLQFALPATALFAICVVYGRMSADGEIATLKAAGISPLRALAPGFAFGLLLSPLAVWLGDLAVSWGRPGLSRVALESMEDIVYRTLRAQHSYSSSKGFSIHVQEVQDRVLMYPVITLHLGQQSESITYTAERGKLELDAERWLLNLHLTNSRILGKVHGHSTGDDVLPIPLDKAMPKGSTEKSSPSELPLWQIPREAARQRLALGVARRELAAEAAGAFATGQWDHLAATSGLQLQSQIVQGVDRLDRLRTEPWRRWAGGFSCLAFILVGAPLSVLVRSADPWTAFGMCFLPILLVYYPLFLYGLEQAKYGSLPPYAVWLGNFVLAGLSTFLTYRVWRY